MTKPTIFIQTNAKQLIGAKVAAHALKRAAAEANAFDVHLIMVEDHTAIYGRHGQEYLREGRRTVWNNDDLQSFTLTRFLPPTLMGFTGRALVIDPDVFAIADPGDLLSMDMDGKSIFCRKIVPSDGRKPYWATSVMLLDCGRLAHWDWERQITEMFAFRRDYRDWMSLALEPQETVGQLDDEWNHYDVLDERTRMLHTTRRLTQPWKTGLPIDFSSDKTEVGRTSSRIGPVPRAWLRRARSIMTGRRFIPNGYYREHPDPNQERLFFDLLAECIESGSVTDAELRGEIARQHIRPDAIEMLKALSA